MYHITIKKKINRLVKKDEDGTDDLEEIYEKFFHKAAKRAKKI